MASGAAAALTGLGVGPSATPNLPRVRGAVYFPAHAWNAYQFWRDYRPAVIERDFSYARRLGLNSLRLYLGYEFWLEQPETFGRRLDHLLATAAAHDLAVLPICFDGVGVEPTPETLNGEYPARSPSHEVIMDDWSEPRRFVEWVAERYDPFALELMNEPGGWRERERFTREMVRTARCTDPDIPLTVGHKDPKYWTDDVDILQFHLNHPPSVGWLRDAIDSATEQADRPVWLSEWQRLLRGRTVPLPNYASMAHVIRESDLDGDYFWQLMYQPGFMLAPRGRGNMDGVFYPDGSVFSQDDYDALRLIDTPQLPTLRVVRPVSGTACIDAALEAAGDDGDDGDDADDTDDDDDDDGDYDDADDDDGDDTDDGDDDDGDDTDDGADAASTTDDGDDAASTTDDGDVAGG